MLGVALALAFVAGCGADDGAGTTGTQAARAAEKGPAAKREAWISLDGHDGPHDQIRDR